MIAITINMIIDSCITSVGYTNEKVARILNYRIPRVTLGYLDIINTKFHPLFAPANEEELETLDQLVLDLKKICDKIKKNNTCTRSELLSIAEKIFLLYESCVQIKNEYKIPEYTVKIFEKIYDDITSMYKNCKNNHLELISYRSISSYRDRNYCIDHRRTIVSVCFITWVLLSTLKDKWGTVRDRLNDLFVNYNINYTFGDDYQCEMEKLNQIIDCYRQSKDITVVLDKHDQSPQATYPSPQDIPPDNPSCNIKLFQMMTDFEVTHKLFLYFNNLVGGDINEKIFSKEFHKEIFCSWITYCSNRTSIDADDIDCRNEFLSQILSMNEWKEYLKERNIDMSFGDIIYNSSEKKIILEFKEGIVSSKLFKAFVVMRGEKY